MADVYVKSGSGALPFNNDVVATARAYTLGERMVARRADATANNAVAKAWVWEVTTAGTSGTTDPTWPATVTQDVTTVTSGTVVFTARKPGFSSGTTANWSFATIYLQYATLAMVAGDRLFMSHLHNQSETISTLTISFPNSDTPSYWYNVNDSQTDPVLMQHNIALSPNISVSNGPSVTIAGNVSMHGVWVQKGSGGGGAIFIGNSTSSIRAINCSFVINDFNTTPSIEIVSDNSVASRRRCYFEKCGFSVINASNRITISNVEVQFKDCYWITSSQNLINVFQCPTASKVLIDGFDFSGLPAATGLIMNLFVTSQGNSCGTYILRNVKLPVGWSGQIFNSISAEQLTAEFSNVETSNSQKIMYGKRCRSGTLDSDMTVYRAGGASEQGIPFSYKLTGNSFTSLTNPLSTNDIVRYVNEAGVQRTLQLEILTSFSQLTTADFYVELSFMGNSGNRRNVTISSTTASTTLNPVLITTSLSNWNDAGVPTPVRHKIIIPFTTTEPGLIYCRAHLAKPNTTVYVCPKVEVL